MKYILTFLLFCAPLFAANNDATKQSAPVQAAQKDYKDQFLELILKKAEKYTDAAENALGQAVDIVQKEAPELAREYIVWRICYHAICSLVPVVIFTVFFVTWRKSLGKGNWSSYDGSPSNSKAWLIVVSCIGWIVSLIVMFIVWVGFGHIYKLVQCLVAPKIYIIEQVIALIKH